MFLGGGKRRQKWREKKEGEKYILFEELSWIFKTTKQEGIAIIVVKRKEFALKNIAT